MKHKLLSVLLALAMALTILPASALAANDTDTAQAKQFLADFQSAPVKTWDLLYKLVLRANGAVGSVEQATKDEITNYLASLETLTLTGPKAYQTAFPDLGVLVGLTGLKSLSITDAMEGTDTPLDLGALANLRNLEHLALCGKNNITDAGFLERCTNLKSLDLSGSSTLIDFGGLHFTSKLESLNVSGTGFSDSAFDALSSLSSLASLNVSGTKISDINNLTMKTAPCQALENLDISNTSVRSLDPFIKNDSTAALPKLVTLAARGLELDSVDGLAKAVALENNKITSCDMSGSSVLGAAGGTQVAAIASKLGTSFKAPLANAPAGNDVEKAETWQANFVLGLGNDNGKTSLTWDTLITAVYYYHQAQAYLETEAAKNAANYTDLQKRVADLTTYYTTQVTKLDMSGKTESRFAISTGALTDFTGLTELNLSGVGISEYGGLAELTKLTKLDLSNNPEVTASCFGSLKGLALTELNLSGTGVADIGGMSAGGSENKIAAVLTTLDISNTPVTKIESVWNGTASVFPNLTTLTAQSLTGLTSITGLAAWANNQTAAAKVVKWDLSGGKLTCDNAAAQVDAIKTALGEKFLPPEVPAPVIYTIKFAAGDGTGTMTDAAYPKANTGNTTYVLPVCTFTAPTGKAFKGWTVTPVDKGITLNASTLVIPAAVEAGTVITLTAQWQDTPAADKSITVETPTNGTVKILVNGTELTNGNLKTAEGTVVTVQATPSTGYQLDTIQVLTAPASGTGSPATVTNGAFTMPNENVKVTVTFKSTPKTPGVNKTTANVTVGSTTDEINVTTDGTVTAVSSDTSIATVSVAAQKVSITGVAPGTATVTITAGKGSQYAAGQFTVSVTVTATAATKVEITLNTTGLKAGDLLPKAMTTAMGVKLTTVWKNAKGEVVTTVKAGETYTPTVTVEPEENYELPENMTYTVNNQEVKLDGNELVSKNSTSQDPKPPVVPPVEIPSDIQTGKVTCLYNQYTPGTADYLKWGSGKVTLKNLTAGHYYLVQTSNTSSDTGYRLYQIVEAKADGVAELIAQSGSYLWVMDAGTTRNNVFNTSTWQTVFKGVQMIDGNVLHGPTSAS